MSSYRCFALCPLCPKRLGRSKRRTTRKPALAGIAAQEAFFRSIGMPVRIPALSCGRQDEADLADLASRCSYGRTRTIGTFRVLGYDDILAIYQLANNEE